ncbi:MFS transporter [Woeseiaceae bacterium]|nr:MFS transporter [Woeseiaceae bacterium]MDB2544249.1 MFS transporter [Woeseiaceae bacterium]|tara:strand:- start:825 stop:2141 length:1317 start_codon:yes stop_codon:yes gene_type:complete
MDNSIKSLNNFIDKGSITSQQILVVALCFIFNMLDGFDITAMAVVASSVSLDLNLTDDLLGWIFSFALAGMMVGAMVLAPVADIIGRRALIILSLVLVGLSIFLTAKADNLSLFIMLRFISGVGAGALLACQASLAAEYSPEKYRAMSVALVTAGYPTGAMMTSVVAGYILPDYGWRAMFLFGGTITLGMVVVAWLMIPESLKYLLEKRPTNALEKINRILQKLKHSPIEHLPEFIKNDENKTTLLSNMKMLLSPKYRTLSLTLWTAFFCAFGTLYFLMSWIPKLMENAGYNISAGRDAFLYFNLGGVIGIYLLGFLSIKLKLTNLIFSLSIASAISMIAFAYAPNELNTLLILLVVIGILQQSAFTGLYGVAAKAYPTEIRSTGVGWAIGLGRTGAVVGPALAGYLILAGYDMSANFIFFSIPMIICGFIAYRLHID